MMMMPIAPPHAAIYRSAPAAEPTLSTERRLRSASFRPTPRLRSTATAFHQTGIASWYGSVHRHPTTASGEPYNPDALTAAHRWLPLNTWVRVTDLQNGRSVTVRINDRGPYVRGRILDLSVEAAHALHMKAQGVAPVRIEIVAEKKPPPVARRGFDRSAMAWADQTE